MVGMPSTGSGAELAGWIRELAPAAAELWADIVPSLQSCRGTCPRNEDGDIHWLTIGYGCLPGQIACVRPVKQNIEDAIDDFRTMYFPPMPTFASSTMTMTGIWTRDRQKDGDLVDPTIENVIYIWLDMVVVHEFGHTYGLLDYLGDPAYFGIMDITDVRYRGDNQIKQDDRDKLKEIYKSHTMNEGW